MQNYADRANDLIERIDNGEINPDDVDLTPFVERDDVVLTPGLADRLPEEKIQEYSQRVRQRDHKDLREEQREQSEEYEDALSKLRDADDDNTATVTLGETELTVRTYLDGKREREFERLQNNRDDPDIQRDIIPELFAWLVEAPSEYTDPDLWRAYGEEYGRDELMLAFMHALEPKLDRADDDEVLQKFRDRGGRETLPSDQ